MGDNLTVIVVTHNRWDYTRRTLDSLFKTVPEAYFLIIDNNSDEETVLGLEEIACKNNNVELIFRDENEGWGKAVNYAMNYLLEDYDLLQNEYVLISNNDVEYFEGWYTRCLMVYEKYSKIGILGVWKHISHGVLENKGDLIIKDQMPAVGWLMTVRHILDIGEVPEHGPCLTKGGNGEDVGYCIKTAEKGYWVCGLPEDVANHFDGY